MKQDTGFRKGQAHSCGSVLQFLLTVIGDWLSTLQTIGKETNIRAQHVLVPLARHFPSSLTLTSATLLPGFQPLHSHEVTSSGGGETVYNCTICGVVSHTALWGQTGTATSWRQYPAPWWRWTGLLHLLWEAAWSSAGGVRAIRARFRARVLWTDRHLINWNLKYDRHTGEEGGDGEGFLILCHSPCVSLSLSPKGEARRRKVREAGSV